MPNLVQYCKRAFFVAALELARLAPHPIPVQSAQTRLCCNTWGDWERVVGWHLGGEEGAFLGREGGTRENCAQVEGGISGSSAS